LRWEIPWSRWASASDPVHVEGVLQAQPCPDCGGTGALIRMDGIAMPELKLASRRGLRRQSTYANHVETLLHARVTKH
jgi:hypothetical protein